MTTVPVENYIHRDNSIPLGKYNVSNELGNEIIACYLHDRIKSENLWKSVNPMINSLPLFVLQLSLILFTTRLVNQILKPLHQPRLVADIISGILLGATALGQLRNVTAIIYPFESTLLLETMANLGLMYYMFLVGLEMDLTPILHVRKKALIISIAGILAPMLAGYGLYNLFTVYYNITPVLGGVFWAIALTVTSFPDVARLLSYLKLMHTDLGKTALTLALVNDVVSFVLIVAAITVRNGNKFMLLATLVFIPICWFVLRPAVSWLIRHSVASKGSETTQGKYSDVHVYYILSAVAVFGFITDACGSHSMIGAFMFGLMIPPGELGMKVMESLEEFVTRIMLPAFFLTSGLRTNIIDLFRTNDNIFILVLTIALAYFTKIVSTWFVSSFLGFKPMDGFALGVLMNTKGVLALILINAGRNLQSFNQPTFAVMLLSYLIMTMSVGPIITFVYKPAKRFKQYKKRTLERSKPDSELRVITCVHSIRNVSGITNLLQLSNPTKKSPLCVFALHLVELTGRATAAMLIVHDTLNSGANNASREKVEDNQIITSFKNLERTYAEGVSVQTLTVVSSYASMHEDVINFAEDKLVTLILVPFHKQSTADGSLEDSNPSIRQVNQNLLESSPCSVGIYVDRGLGSIKHTDSRHGQKQKQLRIAMLFIGGSDDREALAYAWRMAGNPGITLTVVRFVPGKDTVNVRSEDLTSLTKIESEKQIDDAYISKFRFRWMCYESITYANKLVNNEEQIVEAIRKSYNDFDLYIVGRRKGPSPLTSELAEWSECPELGSIGDILVGSNFLSLASVLVVQQYVATTAGGSKTLPGTKRPGEKLAHTNQQWPLGNQEFETFVNHRKRDSDDDSFG